MRNSSYLRQLYRPLLLAFCVVLSSPVVAQDVAQTAVGLFLDCEFCDHAFIKQEFNAVNYVRAQQDASVHVLVARQHTAGGGATYELSFIGQGVFDGMNNLLFFSTQPNDSQDDIRKGMLKIIQIGTLPYLARSGWEDVVNLSIQKAEAVPVNGQANKDPWGNWIFEVSANGNMNLESLQKKYALHTGIRADHVTEQWRIQLRGYSHLNRTVISGESEEFVSERRHQGGWGSLAYSLGDHWSVGGGVNSFHDTYQNIDYHLSLAPAIEYSFFPYREVMRRELTVAYRLRGLYQDYAEVTVYNRMNEMLAQQELQIALRFRQPWGQLYAGLNGSHYFDDPAKFRTSFDANVDLRIVRGLAVRVSGHMKLIRDQVSLPAGGSSLEDLLLQQRQLATDYQMGLHAGLSYTFGSMYNNIVNTRL